VRVAKEGWEATNDSKTSSLGPRPESYGLGQNAKRIVERSCFGRHLSQSAPRCPMLAVLFQSSCAGRLQSSVRGLKAKPGIRSDMSAHSSLNRRSNELAGKRCSSYHLRIEQVPLRTCGNARDIHPRD
jgi:hypothetical protein